MSVGGGHNGERFVALVYAETRRLFRTRGVVASLVIAVALILLPGVLLAGLLALQGPSGPLSGQVVLGPNGEAVKDEFMFVHRPLVGDGTITARVASVSGLITYPPPLNDRIVAGVVPWAKAGIIMKSGLTPGARYVAMMVTGSHGVRLQYNFTGDVAGLAPNASRESPIWLRLTRSGDTFTGYDSTTGRRWTRVATVHVGPMPDTVQVGLFVTSPHDLTVSEGASRFTSATAVFGRIELSGKINGRWASVDLGAPKGLPRHLQGRAVEVRGRFSVTGSGDIAPLGLGSGWPIERSLMGTFAGIIAIIAAATAYAADETHKREGSGGLSGRFARVKALAAQSLTIAAAGFVVGGIGAILAVPLGAALLSSSGNTVLPVPPATELRVILGTALLMAWASAFALGLAWWTRRRVAAQVAGLSLVVVPYVLARIGAVPLGVSRWLLRVTPAAGFAIQQSLPAYTQALGPKTPQLGYYPLTPWTGLAVAGAYGVAVLGLAAALAYRADPHADGSPVAAR